MRFIAILAAFLILSVSAWAQRGGGHGSFGGAHTAAGAHSWPTLSIHAGPVMPWSPGGPAGPQNPWATGGNYGRSGIQTGYFGRTGYDRDRGLRGTARYYRQIPYLWGLYPNYYDPFLFDDSGYYDQPNYNGGYEDPNAYSGSGYGPYAPGPDPQTAYLSAEIQQLSNQLSTRQQQAATASQPPSPPPPPIILVLKNGSHLQVQNYAVMAQTFWDFTARPVKKIPVADIDIAASEKLSAANGAEFPNLTVSSGSDQ